MITGPATKITNLGALKAVLGIRHFALYWTYVILFSLLSGLLVNFIFIKNYFKIAMRITAGTGIMFIIYFIVSGFIIMYPDNIPLYGTIFYPSIRKEYANEFIPEKLPANAKRMVWISQASKDRYEFSYDLSIVTDEKTEVIQMRRCEANAPCRV